MKHTPPELCTVACPYCVADVGEPCRTASGGYLNAAAHRSRRTALGLDVPGDYPCPDCGRHYRLPHGLARHRYREHRDPTPRRG